jgi:ATP-dependent RNA helicase DDX24/MAK5
MEDAEGFFGLEEIDGVDIIKGPSGSEVQFKVRIPKLWSIERNANLW